MPPRPTTSTSWSWSAIAARRRSSPRTGSRPIEWLSMTTDALLAQSAIDRLTSSAHTLVIEGPSYRQRTRPGYGAVDSSEGEVDAEQRIIDLREPEHGSPGSV
ncbi:conserved hypothetical protein (plasmid) [Rhodococcus jostii RHA1]|uniref:Uncharacterized protein n=1 Tax=Rhodococcus jostii (strain RHA1) TaxID=101510 RepID=Q0RX66_RHOJR|nr:conserved hypothetical protein [Rhodococcus jostii RHA1]